MTKKHKKAVEVIDSTWALISPTGKVHMGMDGNYYTVCGVEVGYDFERKERGWEVPESKSAIVDCQRCVFNRKGY